MATAQRQSSVGKAHEAERLDHAAARVAGVSVRLAKALVAAGYVRVNTRIRRDKGHLLSADDDIEVQRANDEPTDAPAATTLLAPPHVVATFGDVIAIDKPRGLPTLAVRPHTPQQLTRTQDDAREDSRDGDSLAARIIAAFPASATLRPLGEAGLLQRLDNATTGLILAATTQPACDAMRRCLDDHHLAKLYFAVCRKPATHVAPSNNLFARVTVPLAHRRGDPSRMVTTERGPLFGYPRGAPQYAETDLFVLDAATDAVLVAALTHTGRRHQVRVHCAHVGAALLFDPLYDPFFDRKIDPRTDTPHAHHHLHAGWLGFLHPLTGERCTASCPPDAAFIAACVAHGLDPTHCTTFVDSHAERWI